MHKLSPNWPKAGNSSGSISDARIISCLDLWLFGKVKVIYKHYQSNFQCTGAFCRLCRRHIALSLLLSQLWLILHRVQISIKPDSSIIRMHRGPKCIKAGRMKMRLGTVWLLASLVFCKVAFGGRRLWFLVAKSPVSFGILCDDKCHTFIWLSLNFFLA